MKMILVQYHSKVMKSIELSNSDIKALIDDEDYLLLSKYEWSLKKTKNDNGYVQLKSSGVRINGQRFMHRIILGLTNPDIKSDHINHVGWDNRRENLRACTQQQNIFNNRQRRRCSSIYKGVKFVSSSNKWQTSIQINGVKQHIGYFSTEIDAAKAYNIKASELFGDYAYLNDVDHTSFELPDKRQPSSKYRGVCRRSGEKWHAAITYSHKYIHLGSFTTEVEAAIAYNSAAIKYYGCKAKLNIIKEDFVEKA